MRRVVVGVALAAAAVLQPTAAGAAPLYAFDKVGATPDQVLADMQTCADRASHVPLNTTAVVAPTLIGGLVAGVAIGVYEGVQRAHAMTAASDTCMYGMGYTRLDLTAEETTSFQAARSRPAKQAWMRAFVTQDWSSRIAAAAATQPKILPQLAPEPFAIAGVRIDPASIKLVAASAMDRQPLVTAKLTHRRMATLAADVEADRPVHLKMAAGAVLYSVDGVGLSSPEQTTLWCGPAQASLFGRERASNACLLDTAQGPALMPAGGVPWMMSPEQIPAQLRPEAIASGAADISPLDGDPIGAMDMVLNVRSIDQAFVRVQATAQRDGKTVVIWTGDLYFGDDGRVVLPFWSKRLVLTRNYDKDLDQYSVRASLSDDGSGAGWLDKPDAPVVAAKGGAASGG